MMTTQLQDEAIKINPVDGSRRQQQPGQRQHRPLIFLDIDGVLNTTRQSPQIHLEHHLVSRLKYIAESTDALFVLTTFWRHFHEYIAYTLHRHGINVSRHMLPWPMGVTGGKQCTKSFLLYHQATITQQENNRQHRSDMKNQDHKDDEMTEESVVDDEVEYPSRAEEIEAWLKKYGQKYLGGSSGSSDVTMVCEPEDAININDNVNDDTNDDEYYNASNQGYEYHSSDWRYAILDDRLSAAKPNSPLFERFVFVNTKTGLTELDAERVIRLLLFGDTSS
jgi:hypothetical protein